jgi:hypothetical protein
MTVKLEDGTLYEPGDAAEVRCETHGIITTWGALTGLQRMAVEEGLDTAPALPCLLGP